MSSPGVKVGSWGTVIFSLGGKECLYMDPRKTIIQIGLRCVLLRRLSLAFQLPYGETLS